MNLEELKKNYENFDNVTIAQTAKNPKGLSDDVLQILADEIQKRGLDIEINLKADENQRDQEYVFSPLDEDYIVEPETSFLKAEIESQYPDALKVFAIDSFNFLKAGGFFMLVALLFFHSAFNVVKIDNGFGKFFLGLSFTFVICGYLIFKKKNKSQIIVFPDEIQFQQKYFAGGRRLAIIDVIRLFLSNKKITLKKKKILQINKPESFFSNSILNIELRNGDCFEINCIANKEERKEIYEYINQYLES